MEKEALEDFGLTDKESRIYLQLLKEKKCTASKLAKLTKVNRTTAYLELDNLLKLGLVSYVIKDSKRYYHPAPPEKLIALLDEKKSRIKSVLPKLKSLHSLNSQFHMEVFEGKEGIKTFYQDILNSVKEFYVLGATGKAIKLLEFSYPHFVNKFIRSNIKEKAIANSDSKDIMEKFHPPKFLDIRYFPEGCRSNITTIIYGEKLAIQSLQKENIYVIVIRDKLLVDTYQNYFNLLWKLASPHKTNKSLKKKGDKA